MSSQANNNDSFLRNHVNRVGIPIPFEVSLTQLSDLRVVSPGGMGIKDGKNICVTYFFVRRK